MRKFIVIAVGLAILAAVFQWQLGVRTDEAKYLLNIPYPHPPLLRTILGWTDGWVFQEVFWRVIFAFTLIFSFHLTSSKTGRVLWISSPAVLLAAGTVMLAPIVAIYAAVLLWMLHQPREKVLHPGLIGVLWILMVMTAFQSVLLFPLIAGVLWHRRVPLWQIALVSVVPILLLGLYTASNPLAAASILLQSHKDTALSLWSRTSNVLQLWLLAGGGVGTVLGLYGLIKSKNIWIIGSFLLFTAYVFLGSFLYYAIFFAPFFALGLMYLRHDTKMIVLIVISSIATLLFLRPWPEPSATRQIVTEIVRQGAHGIEIEGPFGHDWQYESPVPVLRYQHGRETPFGSVHVCTADCVPPDNKKLLLIPGVKAAWRF